MASSTKSNGSIPSNGRSGTTKKDKVEERTAPFSLPPAYDLHRSDRINGGDTTEDSINSSSIDYYSSSSPGADDQYEGFRRVGGGEIETSIGPAVMPPSSSYAAAADQDPTQLVRDIVSHSHQHHQHDPYYSPPSVFGTTAEDATATIHVMHSKLLYLLSHPELFHDALTWEDKAQQHDDNDKFDVDSTFEGLSDVNNNNNNNSNTKATQDETFEFNPSDMKKSEGGGGGNYQQRKNGDDEEDDWPPLPFEIFAADAEVVLPQALTATQLFGVERETGIELEAAAGIEGLSHLFLRWLALMPEGDHMNVIRPPGLTVMRIAGGGYRVTAAHRVIWRWMNKFSFSPLEDSNNGSRDHSDAAVNEGLKDTDFDFGDLVTMTIIDVFETDVDGKLLSYCPTFDNRAVHKTQEAVERIRKGASQIKQRMEVIAKSPAGKRVNKAAGQVGRIGMTAALRVGSIVKSKIEEIGTDEMKKQHAGKEEGLEEILQHEIISNAGQGRKSSKKEKKPKKEVIEKPKEETRSLTDRGQGYISDDSASSPTSSRRMEV
ncbi:hypothetical protein ACHAXM_001925 [Skeletonema potamos]|jgi:hypothetical protein